MDRAVNEFERARGRMADDFKTIITDAEDLLKAAATVSGDGFVTARAKFEKKLERAKVALADVSQPVFDRTRETAALANDYAHKNAWAFAGVALAAGALIGFLAAKR
jgi:ElaB/YqjD/DUF883 family membrane-anchored ribosome-binding protein